MQLIENLFGSKGRIKVLKKLSKHMGWQFNISELSKDMALNKGAVSRIVSELEKEGLIIVNKKGKIKLFQLNEKNIFVKEAILPILKIEEELFKNIKKRILRPFSKDLASSIILYGSYSKGSERLESDIDAMVIIKNKALEEKCRLISDKVSQEFLDNGIMLTIDILNEKEFKRLYLDKEPSIVSVVGTGIVIKGKSLEELIK